MSEYEFLLQYDSLPGEYNQWSQKSNPAKTTESVTGYSAKKISWNDNGLNASSQFGGIAKSSNTSTFIDGTVGHNNWYYALGCYKAWNVGGIPGPNTPEINCVYLWLSTSRIKPTEVFSNNDALGNSNTYYFKNESVTLKALWIPNTYQVIYNGNGNTGGSTASSTHTYDVAKALNANGFTKTGYTFAGWATSATGAVAHADKASVKNLATSGTYTLYATWAANKYNIAYAANDGTGTMATQSNVVYDSVVRLSGNAFSNKYTITYVFNDSSTSNQTDNVTRNFSGWKATSGLNASTAKYGTTNNPTTAVSTSTTLSNLVYVKNLSPTNSATVTLTAQWGKAVTTTLKKPTRTGYTFAGWYSDSSCTVKAGDGGATYTPTANTTLYAKWTPISYKITYNLNGGIATNKTTYTIEDTITLNNPTRTGYTFTGWTGSNGTTPQTTVTIARGSTGDKSYTAKWTANKYTTSVYNYQPMNGGGTWTNSVRTESGVTFTPSSDAASVTLNGSMTNANATICFLRGLSVKAGEQYTIRISCMGGSFEKLGTGACIAFDFKRANFDSLTLPRATIGLSSLPSDGESWVSESVLTMTKQNEQEVGSCQFWIWKGSAANSTGNWGFKFSNYKLKVELIKINTLSSVSQTYGSKANKYPVPTLAGFTFNGWYLNSAANGVQLTDSSGNVMSSVDGYTDANGNWIYPNTAKVYSVWTPITYTATFNANGGSVSPSSRNYTYGSFYETLPTPTRTGYTFNGWYGNIDGYTILDYIQSSGTQYIDTGVYTTSDIKVYADFQYTDVTTRQQRPFGHTFDTDTSNNVSFGTYINGNGKWAFAYKDGQGNWQASTVTATTARTYITLDGKNKKFSIRGPATYDCDITTTITRQSNSSLSIFADNRAGNPDNFSKMKLYAFKVWKNGTLIRDYIPVKRNSDGVVGLFDLVGGLFYANAGKGSFTAGTASSTGTVRYEYNHKFLAANKTLTAKWVGNVVTVNFDKNGASGGTSTIYIRRGVNKLYSNEACTNQITKITMPTPPTGYLNGLYMGKNPLGASHQSGYIRDGTPLSNPQNGLYYLVQYFENYPQDTNLTLTLELRARTFKLGVLGYQGDYSFNGGANSLLLHSYNEDKSETWRTENSGTEARWTSLGTKDVSGPIIQNLQNYMVLDREYTLEFSVKGTNGKTVTLEFEAGEIYNSSTLKYESPKKTVTLSSSWTNVSMTFKFWYNSSFNPNSYHALTAYTKWNKNQFISFSNFAIYQTVSYGNKVPIQSPNGTDYYYINSTRFAENNYHQWTSSEDCLPKNLAWNGYRITDANGKWIYLDDLFIHWSVNNG